MDPRAFRKMRHLLLTAARSGATVTYGRLMREQHLPRGRPLTRAIGDVDRLEYERGGPGFAAIIVRKDTGFPGGGYFVGDDLPAGLSRPASRRNDPRLSVREKDHVLRQQKRVWAYYGKDSAG